MRNKGKEVEWQEDSPNPPEGKKVNLSYVDIDDAEDLTEAELALLLRSGCREE